MKGAGEHFLLIRTTRYRDRLLPVQSSFYRKRYRNFRILAVRFTRHVFEIDTRNAKLRI